MESRSGQQSQHLDITTGQIGDRNFGLTSEVKLKIKYKIK